jgi:carbon-monoxide dehydrogenase small subunit
MNVRMDINGQPVEADVEPRLLLTDFLRHHVGLTGTRVGCEHGVCGACTVQLDGYPVRACLMFAVQACGRAVRTVEGMSEGPDLHPLQQAFHEEHALQCGFCTAGFLMTIEPLLPRVPDLDDAEIRELLAGNVCRCTGYQNIVSAVRKAAELTQAETGEDT